MSLETESQSHEDESAPLLEHARTSTFRRPNSWLTDASLITPLALIARVATLIGSTTTFYILQQFICRLYYRTHDPASIPPDGRMSDEMCSLPDIERNYAAFIAAVATMDGIGSFVGYSALSAIASRLGRKAAMTAVLTVGLVANAAIICSTWVAAEMELTLLALWLVASSFSQATLISFTTNIYIVDVVDEEKRTSTLSSLTGWSALGSALSFTIGGMITTRGGKALVVYYIACGLWTTAIFYVWVILAESFPKDKREELRLRRAREAEQAGRTGRRVLSLLIGFLEPLKHLKAERDPHTGRRNWRLVICAVHMFLAGLGAGYASASLITIVTQLYHYTPEETGYTLTAFSGTSMIVLTVVIPLLVRFLRPFYRRRSALGEDDTTSDRLDVHIAVVSWIIETSGFLVFGYMTTRTTQLAAVIWIGCGPGYAPTVRSLVAASVEPIKRGETLGMIEMVWGLGLCFSPLLMGSILSSTISTVPQTVFYVQAIMVVSGAGILLLVKDSDRYKSSI
ncbi:MFS general substrate transporter [Mycena rebaudengoi]|nr:MFS general substrate transporter [Mycena rebaudengoi]